MRSTNTFSILFWADQKNATNNEALIYARITVNQKRANISLKRRVPIKLWDAKKNRSKGYSAEARQLNQYIDQAYTKLFQIYQDLKFQEKLITAKLIKSHFVGDNEQAKTLQNLIDYHSKKIENTLAIGTIRNFGVTENYLNKFLHKVKKTSDVYLKELDYKFLCDFENFLSGYWPRFGGSNVAGAQFGTTDTHTMATDQWVQWERPPKTFTVPATSSDYYSFLRMAINGTVYVDDIKVVEQDLRP